MERHLSDGVGVTNYKFKANNKIGLKGLYPTPSGEFRAGIWSKVDKMHLGNFNTLTEADNARKIAEDKYFVKEIDKLKKIMEGEGTPQFKVKV